MSKNIGWAVVLLGVMGAATGAGANEDIARSIELESNDYVHSTAKAVEHTDDKQDLITLTLIKDVQDHVLYIQLLEGNEFVLRRTLLDNLAMKLFDLNHFMAESKNAKAVNLVCEASKNLRNNFQKVTSNCQNENSEKVCEEAYHLERLCVAKHTQVIMH